MIIVPGYGRLPNQTMLIGEAPGYEEASADPPRPFVGKSGQEQRWYLSRHNLNPDHWYQSNVIKEYTVGNPDPTLAQIDYWTPDLIAEVSTCSPRLIIAVGRFAARWFLGDTCELEMSHGIPHHAGSFDPSRVDRAPANCIVLPVYHPALGFYDGDARALIAYDYAQVAATLDRIRSGQKVHVRQDQYAGLEHYADVDRWELEEYLDLTRNALAIDTEGIPSNPWSIQISSVPGTAIVYRCSQPEFEEGMQEIGRIIQDRSLTVALHNALYDIPMCQAMGLDLSSAHLFDTMYAAYLLRLEPQGLKPLAYRWCGMRMASYSETVGDAGLAKQIAYLHGALTERWPKLEPRLVDTNDGDIKLYRPKQISSRIIKILRDIESGKVNKDGETTDPLARWRAVDDELRGIVESRLGPMPIGTLDDIPLDRAIHYSGRDADATLRLYFALSKELDRAIAP